MKYLKIILALPLLCYFGSCIDTVETIDIKPDNSGTYSIKMDMSKLLEIAASMDKNKEADKDKKEPAKKDTVIQLKDIVDKVKDLSAEEKELLGKGSMAMQFDKPQNKLIISISCPFSKTEQLPLLMKKLPTLFSQLNALDKDANNPLSALGKENEGTEEGDLGLNAMANPSEKFYQFTASAGKLKYSIPDKEGFKKISANDSIMQMMSQMSLMMGDMTKTTVINVPGEIKKYVSPKATLAADKRSLTIATTIMEIMEHPEYTEYEVEY